MRTSLTRFASTSANAAAKQPQRVAGRFPSPVRMVYEALIRQQGSRPTTQDLFAGIHTLYPSMPRQPGQKTEGRWDAGIWIPELKPDEEPDFPNHPVKGMNWFKHGLLPVLEKAGAIEYVLHKPDAKPTKDQTGDDMFLAPAPASTSAPPPFASLPNAPRPKPKAQAAKLAGKKLMRSPFYWRFPSEIAPTEVLPIDAPVPVPSSSTSSTFTATSSSDLLASSPSSSTTAPEVDADGLPPMPEPWRSISAVGVGRRDAEILADNIKVWSSQRDRWGKPLPVPKRELKPGAGLPFPNKKPVKSDRDQLEFDLRTAGNMNRRKQRRTVDLMMEFRRWKEETEEQFLEQGGWETAQRNWLEVQAKNQVADEMIAELEGRALEG